MVQDKQTELKVDKRKGSPRYVPYRLSEAEVQAFYEAANSPALQIKHRNKSLPCLQMRGYIMAVPVRSTYHHSLSPAHK